MTYKSLYVINVHGDYYHRWCVDILWITHQRLLSYTKAHIHVDIHAYTHTSTQTRYANIAVQLASLYCFVSKKSELVLITSLPDQTSDAVTILVQQLGRNKSSCCSPDYVAKTIEPDTNVFPKTTSPYNKNPHTVSVDNGQRSDIRESGEERLRSNKQSLPHRSLSRDGQRKS